MLHTLPASKVEPPVVDQGGVERSTPQALQAGKQDNAAQTKSNGLHSSISTIPRLVSVVEIIKREYLKTLDPKLAQQGSLSGLHQYNEIGSLEEEGFVEGSGNEEQDRQEYIVQALSGRNQCVSCHLLLCSALMCSLARAFSARSKRRQRSCG